MNVIYTPSPPDSIRIFELTCIDPARGGLHSRLSCSQLSAKPEYIALSYAWESGPRNRSVIISEAFVVPVTETLFNALREHLWCTTKLLVLVDQICINQEDDIEKQQQICLMGQIYRQAHQVVARLGDGAPTVSTYMKLLRLLAELDVEITEGGTKVSESDTGPLVLDFVEEMTINRLEELFDFKNPAWQGLIALVVRPWFRRLWVVQETFLSKDLRFRCGGSAISGNTFFTAIQAILPIVTWPPRSIFAAFENARLIGTIRAIYSTGHHISYLLTSASGSSL